MPGLGKLVQRQQPPDELDQEFRRLRLGRRQLRRKIALDLTHTPGNRLLGLAMVNPNVAQLMEEHFQPLPPDPLHTLALRLLVHQLTPDPHEALLELQQFPGQLQTPPDHPAAGEADQGLASPAAEALGVGHEALAGAGPSPTVAELPPLSAEVLLGLLTQHPPAVVAQQALQHVHQGDEIAILLVQALGEGTDDTLVAQLQGVQWLPPGGPVFRWLLDHDQARQALTVAVRQGRMAPAEPPVAPAGEAPRSDPTTPAIPTPVLPEQRRQITGQFIRQVRESVGCTQATWAYIFGVSSRTIQHWETDRHQMRPRSAQILQQIITDPEGETHFRQRGLTLKLPDPDPSAPPESPPNGEPAPPSRRHPGSGNSGAVSAGSSAGTAPPRPPAR